MRGSAAGRLLDSVRHRDVRIVSCQRMASSCPPVLDRHVGLLGCVPEYQNVIQGKRARFLPCAATVRVMDGGPVGWRVKNLPMVDKKCCGMARDAVVWGQLKQRMQWMKEACDDSVHRS